MRNALMAVGIVVLVLALVAYGYTVTETDNYLGGLFTDEDTGTPYRNLALPMLIVGIVLIIISATVTDRDAPRQKS